MTRHRKQGKAWDDGGISCAASHLDRERQMDRASAVVEGHVMKVHRMRKER